jgi:predicted RNase H-like HicB family nuclease
MPSSTPKPSEPLRLPLRMALRAVLYREAEFWVAHCLELDLIGHGETKEAALLLLSEAIAAQIEATAEVGNLRNLFTPAEGRFFAMYAAGKDVLVGELVVQPVNHLTVEGVTAREFSEAEAAASGLELVGA